MEDEDEKEKLMKSKRIKDPFEQRLKLISEDTAPFGLPLAWNIKHYGDTSFYPTETKKGTPLDCHGTTIIECMTWPGWKMAVYKGKSFNVYVGYL